MDTSVKIGEQSYNGAHALKLGKAEWTKDPDVLGHFGGDSSKAGQAFDSIVKELDTRKADEVKENSTSEAALKEQQAAQKKLEARESKTPVAETSPSK